MMTTMTRNAASVELAGMGLGESMKNNSPVTIEEKERWLSRARGIKLELAALEETKKEATEKATSTTAGYKAIVVNGSSDPHKFDYVAVLALAIKEREAELRKAQAVITKAIGTVKDPTQRALLQQRYVNCKYWHEVAKSIHYSEQQTYTLHKKALKEIRITRSMINAESLENSGGIRN